jgi:hypothetical protein
MGLARLRSSCFIDMARTSYSAMLTTKKAYNSRKTLERTSMKITNQSVRVYSNGCAVMVVPIDVVSHNNKRLSTDRYCGCQCRTTDHFLLERYIGWKWGPGGTRLASHRYQSQRDYGDRKVGSILFPKECCRGRRRTVRHCRQSRRLSPRE